MTVQVTRSAAEQLRGLLEREAEPRPALRIAAVHRCHCGKVRFGMGWERQERPDDTVIETQGLRIVIDPGTAPDLDEAVVDYRTQGGRAGFVIETPQAGSG